MGGATFQFETGEFDLDCDTFTDAYLHLARYRKLPDDFCRLDLSDERGSTLAHWATFYQALPEDFEYWHWADKQGSTVAHWAVGNGNLPQRFTAWHLVDGDGVTVIENLVKLGMEYWTDRAALFALKVRPELDLTVADYILKSDLKQEYPELKAEVLAWKVAQEIHKGGGDGHLEKSPQRPFLR